MNLKLTFSLAITGLLAGTTLAQSGLILDIKPGRGPSEISSDVEDLAARLGRNVAILTRRARAERHQTLPVMLPVTVTLRKGGALLLPPKLRGRGDAIVLQFDATFPSAYRQLLQDVYQSAKPVMDAVFGSPEPGGIVKVINYDAEIGARDAVAGGIFVPNNGSSQQEIRFPIYSDQSGFKAEVAAVNFVHTLLLAYLGRAPFPNDAWNEGLVRAAVMRVVRTPGALPATLDSNLVEGVLESTYDVGDAYDWCNQRALGGPRFIAPNLVNTNLPDGGSVGGLYLLRYQMAGSTFQKVLVEQPGFISALRTRWATFTGGTTPPELATLAESALRDAGGSPNVEGQTFTQWSKRQYLLDTRLNPGLKLMVQPFAIVDGLGGNDFGVFGVQAHYFETKTNGDEALLSGTSWPIFLGPDGGRFFTSAQEDKMDIFAAYGSIAPNFGADAFNNQNYRVIVDIPVADRVARCILPAGAIARPGSEISNVYGTVTGLATDALATDRVRVSWTGGNDQVPVVNGAFGKKIITPSFLQSQRLSLEVIRTKNNIETIVMRRQVNKGPGAIALDLRPGEEAGPQVIAIPKGISAIGFSVDPFASTPNDVLGLPAGTYLHARWNPVLNRYDYFPAGGGPRQGAGFFVRSDQNRTASVEGRTTVNAPATIALRPGWNLIANPLRTAVALTNLQVIVTTDFPTSWTEAVGTSVGRDVFGFTPGANDSISGVPETGSFVAATTLAPGKAYYIRVFAPEGAVLVFPSGTASRSAGNQPVQGWSLRSQVLQNGTEAGAWIGQAPGATRSFDRKFDSPLPPTFGGLQVVTDMALVRDTRAPGQAQYELRISGLKPGLASSITFSRGDGIPPRLTVKDLQTGAVKFVTAGQSLQFTPGKTTYQFQITAGGNS